MIIFIFMMSRYWFDFADYFDKTDEEKELMVQQLVFDIGIRLISGDLKWENVVQSLRIKEDRAAQNELYEEAQFYNDLIKILEDENEKVRGL